MKQKTIISKATGGSCPRAPSDKPLSKLMKAAWDQGARFKQTRKGWLIYPVDRDADGVLVHLTNSDHRAVNNVRSLLRDKGFDV